MTPAPRKCVKCRALFDPESPYFFMCGPCKRSMEKSNSGYYFDDFSIAARKPGGGYN